MTRAVTGGLALRRRLSGVLAAMLLSACAPVGLDTLQQDLTRAAQEQLKKTLAAQFTREFGKGITTVVTHLARPGGYLDHPVARILLPPPLGLALGVARDLSTDPQAQLLTVLMNQAAEQAIPGAAPILQAALTQITPAEALQVFNGDKTAGTELLKDRTATIVQAALAPVITERLAVSGAPLLYKDLFEIGPSPDETQSAQAAPAEPLQRPPADLGDYVTQQAMTGLYKALGEQEIFIRNNIAGLTGGAVRGGPGPAPHNAAPGTQ